MSEKRIYEIRLRGRLGPEWSAWFNALSIVNHPDGQSMLIGPVADQAELHGLLDRIRDLGLVLLSVNSLDLEPPGTESDGVCLDGEQAEEGIVALFTTLQVEEEEDRPC